jgi:hypothetical protein
LVANNPKRLLINAPPACLDGSSCPIIVSSGALTAFEGNRVKTAPSWHNQEVRATAPLEGCYPLVRGCVSRPETPAIIHPSRPGQCGRIVAARPSVRRGMSNPSVPPRLSHRRATASGGWQGFESNLNARRGSGIRGGGEPQSEQGHAGSHAGAAGERKLELSL